MTNALHEPFAWGLNDCCTFAASWVQISTGEDALRTFSRHWRTAAGAARVLKRHGGLMAAVTRVLGEPVRPALAHRGDLLLMPANLTAERMMGGCLGVSFGSRVGSPGQGGLALIPAGEAVACWRIGEP